MEVIVVIHQICQFPRYETHTGDNMVQKLLSSPQQDKTPERQVLGHRMISTRCYRPGGEHALSCMEKTAGREGENKFIEQACMPGIFKLNKFII